MPFAKEGRLAFYQETLMQDRLYPDKSAAHIISAVCLYYCQFVIACLLTAVCILVLACYIIQQDLFHPGTITALYLKTMEIGIDMGQNS